MWPNNFSLSTFASKNALTGSDWRDKAGCSLFETLKRSKLSLNHHSRISTGCYDSLPGSHQILFPSKKRVKTWFKINNRSPYKTGKPMREKREKKMQRPEYPWILLTPKQYVCAFAPFPRSTWIHPHVPYDNFDRVCKIIWGRAKDAEEELDRGQSSKAADSKPSQVKAGKQQKKTDDLGLSTPYKEEEEQQYHTDFILPRPYLLGRRHSHVAKSARVLSPVMEVEMKRNEVEAKEERNLRVVEDQQSVENSLKKIWVIQSSSSRGDEQSFAPEPQPLEPNPVCSAAEDHTSDLQEREDPPRPSTLQTDKCESEDEQNMRNCSDGNSSNDGDLETLPGLQSSATDSSDDESGCNSKSCDEEKNAVPQSDELSSDSEQDSPTLSTEDDFPPLSTMKAGILPHPTEPPASGKLHGQWEIPLSFHPHVIPTATLASGVTTHAQASVQRKAKAPQANSKTSATPTAPMQQGAYDLLADFPALQPPKKPLILGILRDGNPKAKAGERRRGLTHSPNQSQESGASHQRRMENVPHEVSSICAGDQKSELDLQTFGSTSRINSPTISCEELEANAQLPPRVAGADGVGVNARSWASAAKAGMKRAAAPQEKARPCTFQQIVTLNKAKAGHFSAQNTKRVTPFNQTAARLASTMCCDHQPRNPNQFIRPGNPHNRQQYGTWAHQANRSPGFRCPRFSFQQARGRPPKHFHE